MGIGSDIHSVNEKQLRNTLRKLGAVRTVIEQILIDDFPYLHGREALEAIDELFESRQLAIEATDPAADRAVVNRLCQAAQETISLYLPLVGFVLRSTNIRNAFELYGPLLGVAQAALGKDAHLVVSSEWEFSPYTLIPPSIGGTAFVLIGLPASESENALVTPLAGHELGHSVWAVEALESKYGALIETEVENAIRGPRWAEFIKEFPQVGTRGKISDLIGRQIWEPAWTWCTQQLEELFCDAIGILVFAESYLHAFSYLLAPSIQLERSVHYPSIKDRVEFMQRVFDDLGFPRIKDYGLCFDDDQVVGTSAKKVLLSVSDTARLALENKVWEEAKKIHSTWNFPAHSNSEIDEICKSFEVITPATRATSVANIVNAGWRTYLNGFKPWKEYEVAKNNPKKCESILNDLILKSAEVLEIQQRTSTT